MDGGGGTTEGGLRRTGEEEDARHVLQEEVECLSDQEVAVRVQSECGEESEGGYVGGRVVEAEGEGGPRAGTVEAAAVAGAAGEDEGGVQAGK